MVRWRRPLAIATAVVFIVSSAFPVVAGLSKNTAAFPRLWGKLDVGLAFLLAVMVFGVMALARNSVDKQAEESSYRAYRVLLHGIFVMLVVFFVFGDRIIWINCLTGFVWRSWLLLYALPEWIVAVRTGAPSS
jgi:FtsH-binding integral membrane protein